MTAKKQCLLRLGVLRQVGPVPRREEGGRKSKGRMGGRDRKRKKCRTEGWDRERTGR